MKRIFCLLLAACMTAFPLRLRERQRKGRRK